MAIINGIVSGEPYPPGFTPRYMNNFIRTGTVSRMEYATLSAGKALFRLSDGTLVGKLTAGTGAGTFAGVITRVGRPCGDAQYDEPFIEFLEEDCGMRVAALCPPIFTGTFKSYACFNAAGDLVDPVDKISMAEVISHPFTFPGMSRGIIMVRLRTANANGPIVLTPE